MSLQAREKEALELARTGRPIPPRRDQSDGWVQFGLHSLLSIAGSVRVLSPPWSGRSVKADGSPTTVLEAEIEASVRGALREFAPEASFLGEETGGRMLETGWTVAVDPIDGTYAYLGHTETFASVLTVFEDGSPRIGFVASALTGEFGYAEAGKSTRLLRLDIFGEDDQAADLPLAGADSSAVLVNLHPARRDGSTLPALMDGWRHGRVRMVRSPGGSPSWALLGAARGHFVYVNRWGKKPASPWDLSAGVLLVRGAGGEVVDLSGRPIDPLGHEGTFVAGVRTDHRERVVELLNRASRGDDPVV
jgi:fructose-1,6-bisphosphatase/inositol monophosphatase family enzyme